jgi:hypothetical protein
MGVGDVTQYYLVSEEELYWIKNDCRHPLLPGCDGCEYHRDNSDPCAFKGANALMDEVLTRPYNPEADRAKMVMKIWEGVVHKRCVDTPRKIELQDLWDILQDIIRGV